MALEQTTTEHDEFYIGYAPPMPPRLARFVTRAVVLPLACVLPVWAAVLVAGHVPLDGGTFEFGRPADFSGVVVAEPYPALRPAGSEPAAAAPWPLLVAPGKHGADVLVRGAEGRLVSFRGTRIHRGRHTMIEVDPNSWSVKGAAEQPSPAVARSGSGPLEVRGEIVDSKCFLGVMVPGEGKTHKECASLCLRGGIPPALRVRDRAGHSSLLLLAGREGEPIGAHALQAAGEAIAVAGVMERQGGWLILRTNPATWRRIDE